jgi:hypothetical protein
VVDLSEEKLFIREFWGKWQAVDDSPVFREGSYSSGFIKVVETVAIECFGGVNSSPESHSHSSFVPA